MVHIRLDDDLKEKSNSILEAVGLSMSDAVRLFLRRVVLENGYPLELKLPSEATRMAIAEADEILRENRARAMTAEEVFNELEEGRKKTGRG